MIYEYGYDVLCIFVYSGMNYEYGYDVLCMFVPSGMHYECSFIVIYILYIPEIIHINQLVSTIFTSLELFVFKLVLP